MNYLIIIVIYQVLLNGIYTEDNHLNEIYTYLNICSRQIYTEL